MNRLKSLFDWLVMALCVACIIAVCADCPAENDIILWLGGFGLVYCVAHLLMILFRRIALDWILVKGNFMLKVVNFVVLIPFVLVFAFHVADNRSRTGCDVQSSYAPANLIDSDSLYSAPQAVGPHEDPSLLWGIYMHYMDPGNQHMASSKSGRDRAAIIAILGYILLNGLLVSTLISWFDRRRDQWLKGEVRYGCFLKLHPHYVIIGGNDMVSGLVKQIFEKDRCAYILIQTSCEVGKFRAELFSNLSERQRKRIIIYYGNRTSSDDVKDLRLGLATKELYILGEETRNDDIESYHDSMNMDCLQLVYEQYSQAIFAKCRKLRCRVMFEYQTTFAVFQYSEISSAIKQYIDFKPFNYYEMWAQKVLVNKSLKCDAASSAYLPLEGTECISSDSDKYVHLFIVGMSRMGVAMAIEAAHMAHYPNFASKNIRTRITLIDTDAKTEKEFFMRRFSDLFKLSRWTYKCLDAHGVLSVVDSYIPTDYEHLGGDFMDIDWEFINGGIEMKAIQDYVLSAARQENSVVTIAVCLPEPSRALASALYFDRELYSHVSQILVYNRYGDALVRNMIHHKKDNLNPYNNKLRPFGMASSCYDSKIIADAEYIGAELGKEYDKIYRQMDEVNEGETLGKSQTAKWWSNIYAANTMWTKLRSAGWSMGQTLGEGQIDILAQTEHSRWNMEQLLIGYRPLTEAEQKDVLVDISLKGPKKSEMAHYDICSYEKLKQIDIRSIKFDKGLTKILPAIYTALNTSAPNEQCHEK